MWSRNETRIEADIRRGKKVTTSRHLIVLGAGNVAREVIDIVSDINEASRSKLRIVFLAEDSSEVPERTVYGIKVINSRKVLRMNSEDVKLLCAVGDQVRARWIASFESAGFKFATLIHPSAVIAQHATIGDGSVIYPNSFVSSNAIIGRHVLLQAHCSIMHDVEIGDFCTVCSGVHIGGYTKVGARCFIGIGAVIVDRVTIGEGTIIGAGSTVLQDIPTNVVAVGTPARILRRIEQ